MQNFTMLFMFMNSWFAFYKVLIEHFKSVLTFLILSVYTRFLQNFAKFWWDELMYIWLGMGWGSWLEDLHAQLESSVDFDPSESQGHCYVPLCSNTWLLSITVLSHRYPSYCSLWCSRHIFWIVEMKSFILIVFAPWCNLIVIWLNPKTLFLRGQPPNKIHFHGALLNMSVTVCYLFLEPFSILHYAGMRKLPF